MCRCIIYFLIYTMGCMHAYVCPPPHDEGCDDDVDFQECVDEEMEVAPHMAGYDACDDLMDALERVAGRRRKVNTGKYMALMWKLSRTHGAYLTEIGARDMVWEMERRDRGRGWKKLLGRLPLEEGEVLVL